ncbi:MAG: hypothetical protein V1646_04300 [bacterium]
MKKIFLGLAFTVISMFGSDVFAMAHHLTITGVYRDGNIVNLTFNNHARIRYNSVDSNMQCFAPDGQEVNPVPGDIADLVLRRIHNDGVNIPHLARTTGASVAAFVSFLIASGLASKLSWIANFDRDNFFGNCAKVAWQHSNYARGAICSTADIGSDLIVTIFPYFMGVILAVIIFKKING